MFWVQGLDFIQLQLGVNRSHNDKLMPTGSFRTAVKEVKRRVEMEGVVGFGVWGVGVFARELRCDPHRRN